MLKGLQGGRGSDSILHALVWLESLVTQPWRGWKASFGVDMHTVLQKASPLGSGTFVYCKFPLGWWTVTPMTLTLVFMWSFMPLLKPWLYVCVLWWDVLGKQGITLPSL